jgi:hypothetical protein
MQNNLNDSINEIKDFSKNVEEAINNEDNELTEEEKKEEPDYLLYNAISETSISILQQESVIKLFEKISDKLGDDITKSLIELMTLTMTHSAFNAIVFYDGLLKGELTNQFDHYGNHLNNTSAIVRSHDSVLEVFGKRITDLENKLKIDEINKSL